MSRTPTACHNMDNPWTPPEWVLGPHHWLGCVQLSKRSGCAGRPMRRSSSGGHQNMYRPLPHPPRRIAVVHVHTCAHNNVPCFPAFLAHWVGRPTDSGAEASCVTSLPLISTTAITMFTAPARDNIPSSSPRPPSSFRLSSLTRLLSPKMPLLCSAHCIARCVLFGCPTYPLPQAFVYCTALN